MKFTFHDPDQLSLFDAVTSKGSSASATETQRNSAPVTNVPATTIPVSAKPVKNIPKKPVMPAVLKALQGTVPMDVFMKAAKLSSVGFGEGHRGDCRYTSNGKTIMHGVGNRYSCDLFFNYL